MKLGNSVFDLLQGETLNPKPRRGTVGTNFRGGRKGIVGAI